VRPCRAGDHCRLRPGGVLQHNQTLGLWHRTCITTFGKASGHARTKTRYQMGIYGALSTAVTGLQAQSFALENISGNIANSQTTGYKRIETSFEDMIPDGKPQTQVAGSGGARRQAPNTGRG